MTVTARSGAAPSTCLKDDGDAQEDLALPGTSLFQRSSASDTAAALSNDDVNDV